MLTIKRTGPDNDFGLAVAPGDICFAAWDESGLLGSCLCRLSDDLGEVRLLRLETRERDFPLADGLARAALASVRDVARTVRVAGDGEALRYFEKLSGAFEDHIAPLEKIFKTCC